MERRKEEFLCLWISWVMLGAVVYSQRPPRLLPQARDTHKIVPEGTNVHLPCPVDGDPDNLFFQWYKGKEQLSMFDTDRFRVTSGGTLKIKDTVADDTGLYVCRVVNGFGIVQFNISLIVLTDHDYGGEVNRESQGSQQNNLYPDADDFDVSGIPSGKPRFTQLTTFQHQIIHRPLGSSIRLKCGATAASRPQITWLKNGKPMPDMQHSSLGKRGKWTLYLQNLQISDSGNYTCIVYNAYGSINNSFVLDVVDRVHSKPEMTGSHPLNTTVEYGGTAVFQCRVKSDVPPHVQWLKKINEEDLENHAENKNIINVQNEYFRVLKSTEVMERPDGSFLNKLLIVEAKEQDSGKYICLGANTIGYSFRSAFLTVLSKPQDHHLPSAVTTLPFPIIIAVIVVSAVVLAAVVALLIHCRKRRQVVQRPRPVPTSKPRITMETKHAYLGMAYNPEMVTLKTNNGLPATTRLYIPSNTSSSPGPPGSLCL